MIAINKISFILHVYFYKWFWCLCYTVYSTTVLDYLKETELQSKHADQIMAFLNSHLILI